DISIMPEGLELGLSRQEFADLIDYLASLKLPNSAAAMGRGMPATIAELAKPVSFRPFSHSRFEHPVWFGPVPGLADTFAVEEHESGKIWFLKPGEQADSRTLFLETGHFLPGTRGLVGLVFHPDFAANGRYFYVKHLVTDGHFRAVLYEGQADAARTRDSGRPPSIVLRIDMSSNVHFGAGLQFGPDGYLYVGVGDTGPQGDPHGNAQNMTLLKGKLLRLDVDHVAPGKPYSVPADNPFAGNNDTSAVRPEIWASGLRMAWRFSFDPLTGDLWEGDVGQDLIEEVNLIRRGGNYGWNVFEGFAPYSNKYRRQGETYLPPVFAYSRKFGASVTGGFVYRAKRDSSFYGVYIFGDYQSSRIFGLTQERGVLKTLRQIGRSPEHAVSIGRDNQGELYVVGYEGTIYRLDLDGATFE
ncbi:MAG TPA: PQQ-dependent sugar dehydrogenase, partial [Tepidisphaeraceae bacterium]